jgi:plastocyanin
VTPTHLARKAVAMPLALVFLALAPASAWGVADVIKNSGISFDRPTYSSDQGDLVQYQYTGSLIPHNVTSTESSGGRRLFESATLSSPGTTAVNGTESLAPGTYPFICTIHPLQMRAELVVRGPQPEPSNDFTLGKVKRNKKKGTAKLTVLVPGPGELDLAKNQDVKADQERAEFPQEGVGIYTEGDPGKEELSIKPTGKTTKKLNRTGKAKVEAEVTYTPDGGAPNTEDKKIKLVKR